MQAQKREPMRKEIFIRYRLIFFSALAFFLALMIMLSVQSAALRRTERVAQERQEQVHAANAETAELERYLAFMGTDEYVAQEARRRFGYLEPGERRYQMEGGGAQADMAQFLEGD